MVEAVTATRPRRVGWAKSPGPAPNLVRWRRAILSMRPMRTVAPRAHCAHRAAVGGDGTRAQCAPDASHRGDCLHQTAARKLAANLCLAGCRTDSNSAEAPRPAKPEPTAGLLARGSSPVTAFPGSPSGAVVRARRLQLRGQLRRWNVRSAPHSLFALGSRDRWWGD